MNKLTVYIHGKGGSAEEAEHYNWTDKAYIAPILEVIR